MKHHKEFTIVIDIFHPLGACLREAPPPEALQREGASAKPGEGIEGRGD